MNIGLGQASVAPMRVVQIMGLSVVAVLGSLGCRSHGAQPTAHAPAGKASVVVPINLTWTLGQPAPSWPTAPAGTNIQIRVWTQPSHCVGAPIKELPGTVKVNRAYLNLAPSFALEIADKNNPKAATYLQSSGLGVVNATVGPGRWCLTIADHHCLLDVTVPNQAGAPLVIQPLPDPAIEPTDQSVPGVVIDTSSSIARFDVLPELASRVPPCS